MTDSHGAEGATRSTAIYALFHHSKAFFFPWILVDCRGCFRSEVVTHEFRRFYMYLRHRRILGRTCSVCRPWRFVHGRGLRPLIFSLLVGACVAFLGGMADSCVARCAQPMHGSHSRPGGLFAAFGC